MTYQIKCDKCGKEEEVKETEEGIDLSQEWRTYASKEKAFHFCCIKCFKEF